MAYIDPGNLASDINQGVQAGYSLIWVTLWCTVLGYVMQMTAAKLGVATGRALAEHAREAYPRPARLTLWLLTELGIIACDMIEVIGGAVALNTLSSGAIPLWAGVLITAVTAFGCLLLERAGMRMLEAVLVVLILTMGGTFFYMFFTTDVDYLATLKGMVIPRLNGTTIPYAVGAVGAIIMPHNLYLHSALMISRSAGGRCAVGAGGGEDARGVVTPWPGPPGPLSSTPESPFPCQLCSRAPTPFSPCFSAGRTQSRRCPSSGRCDSCASRARWRCSSRCSSTSPSSPVCGWRGGGGVRGLGAMSVCWRRPRAWAGARACLGLHRSGRARS